MLFSNFLFNGGRSASVSNELSCSNRHLRRIFLHQAHRRQKLYSVFFASINFYVISLRDYKMRIIGFAWDSSCLFPSFAFASQNLGSQLKRKRPILEF